MSDTSSAFKITNVVYNSSTKWNSNVPFEVSNPLKEQYEKDLAERQKRHLERVQERQKYQQPSFSATTWRPCAHDSCTECVGTGIKADGSVCIHMLYCSCPRCVPYSL